MKALRILPLLLALLVPAPANGVDVTADDSADAYAISGAVLLNPSFAEASEAASCGQCQWRVIRTCVGGALEDRAGCLGIPCDSAYAMAEVWRADAVSPPPVGDPAWTFRGTMCLTEPPLPAATVGTGARDLAMRALPPLRATSQPDGRTVTGLATFFRSGQPATFVSAPADVAGVQVVVRAQPTWTWDFGQGPILTTGDPGGTWPRGQVRHTYPRRGLYRVRITSEWRAVYDARGLTGLPVEGTITQSAWFDLRVLEARRYLRDKGQ